MSQRLKTDALLTRAETRIASGYTSGLIGKEIADRLDISYHTVVRHTQNIYDKTCIKHSTNALVAWFLAKNYDIDLSEFNRRLGAFILFCLTTFQIATTDFDNSFVRRTPSRARRVEARKGGAKKGRRDDTYYIDGIEG